MKQSVHRRLTKVVKTSTRCSVLIRGSAAVKSADNVSETVNTIGRIGREARWKRWRSRGYVARLLNVLFYIGPYEIFKHSQRQASLPGCAEIRYVRGAFNVAPTCRFFGGVYKQRHLSAGAVADFPLNARLEEEQSHSHLRPLEVFDRWWRHVNAIRKLMTKLKLIYIYIY